MTADTAREAVEGEPCRGSTSGRQPRTAAPSRTGRRCPPTAATETMAARRSRLLGELDALLERLNEVEGTLPAPHGSPA